MYFFPLVTNCRGAVNHRETSTNLMKMKTQVRKLKNIFFIVSLLCNIKRLLTFDVFVSIFSANRDQKERKEEAKEKEEEEEEDDNFNVNSNNNSICPSDRQS